MRTDPAAHFPAGYREGRAAFVEACGAADLGITTRVHPAAKGPNGNALFIDVACAGARDADTALLLISGTHGVEGYFGSGAITGLLREGLTARLPRCAKAVLLHALNPYGFAWDRRVTEDNVDLNRNFVDHANPPENAAYDALASAIAPADIAREAVKAANAKLTAYARTHGDFALQEAITRGQYRHADGLYYGGTRQAWSALMLRDIVSEHLRGVARLIAIDFHTGLGASGAAELIVESGPDTALYERAKAIWGRRVVSSQTGESLSAALTGTIDAALPGLLPEAEVTVGALEVGAQSLRDVFRALRQDNWLHRNGGLRNPRAAEIKAHIRAAFYPDTRAWKHAVWAAADETVGAALAVL